MLFLFRSAPEVEKRIHSKLFRKFWRSRGTKEPAYITVFNKTNKRMQISVRSLELIFTETDWPATERQLEVSNGQKRDWEVEKNSIQISWQTAMTEY